MSPPRLSVDRLGLALLALALTWLGIDTFRRSGQALRLSEDYGVTVDAPAIDPSSPTGYRDGRRSLLLPTGGADGAHWVMQTQTLIAQGELRMRSVNYDNSPRGREVHWSSPLRWWLAALAWVDAGLGGRPIGLGIERAALWSGPVMLAIALPLIFFWVRQTISPGAALLVPVVAASYHPFAIDFLAGRADHHGLANLAALTAVLSFAVGDLKRNPQWYGRSAMAAALGIWISAVTLLPLLIGLGFGFLVGAWFFRHGSAPPPWLEEPNHLRRWARTGAMVSFGAYLFETLPGPFPLRLEVNHPWYALAWLGAGEVLAWTISRLRHLPLRSIDHLKAILGLIALISLPAVVLATRATTYTVADPFLLALHQEHIAEFQPLSRIVATLGFSFGVLGLVLPLILWLAPVSLLLGRRLADRFRPTLCALAIPATLAVLLGFLQVRWLGLALAAGLPTVVVAWMALESPESSFSLRARRLAVGAVLLLCLPGAIAAWQRTQTSGEIGNEDIRHLAERDLAHWLRLRAGDRPVVLAAPPGLTTRQLYYGSHYGLGTLYWENAEGLARLADFYAARTDEEAHQRALEAGVTHVIFVTWDAFELSLIKLRRGEAGSRTVPTDAFFSRLLQSPIPPVWLRSIPFSLPDHRSLRGAEVRIWEVVTPQTPGRAVNAALQALLESGRADLAPHLSPHLAAAPAELASVLGEATLAAAARDEQAFRQHLSRLHARLGEAATLSPGERLQLVSLFALGRDFATARNQLQMTLANTQEAQVRALTIGQLGDLLSLCDALAPNALHSDLRELARTLLPPSRRP